MPRLQELVKQIDELDPVEREELAFVLSQGMLQMPRTSPACSQDHPSIVTTPGVCGGAARLIRTRIPVWSIERMRQLGFSDIEVLRSYPTLRAEDIVEARSYAAHHQEEIEKAIRENEEE